MTAGLPALANDVILRVVGIKYLVAGRVSESPRLAFFWPARIVLAVFGLLGEKFGPRTGIGQVVNGSGTWPCDKLAGTDRAELFPTRGQIGGLWGIIRFQPENRPKRISASAANDSKQEETKETKEAVRRRQTWRRCLLPSLAWLPRLHNSANRPT